MKSPVRILIVVLLFLFTSGGAWANNITTLAPLFDGGSITVGDKLFDSWELLYYDSSDGRTFNSSNIQVTPLAEGGDYGLRFSVLNDELTVTGDDIYAYVDMQFGFRVSVLDPLYLISDNTLTFYNSVLSYEDDNLNDLGIYIRESIGTANWLDDLGIKDIEFSILDSLLYSDPHATAEFSSQQQLWVTKNILVWAVDSPDTAALYGFDQRFSQTPIPEPSTFILFGSALAGLGLYLRKRRMV